MKKTLRIRPRSQSAALAATIAAGLVGCAEPAAMGPPPSQSTARVEARVAPSAPPEPGPAPAASATALSETKPAATGNPWAPAARLGDWEAVAALIDGLDETLGKKPIARYVRARAALETGDAAKGLALLVGLDAELPLLADTLPRLRAEAALAAGQFTDAATFYEASKTPSDLVLAARARFGANEIKVALAHVDRAIADGARKRDDNAVRAARALRAEILEAKGDRRGANAELEVLVRTAPASAEGRVARQTLAVRGVQLKASERLSIAEALIAAGDASAALEELASIEGAVPRPAWLDAKARALYRARDYEQAAAVFREAASKQSARSGEQRFQAARALARAGHEEEAIQLLTPLAKTKNDVGDKASLQRARLFLQGGRFAEAKDAYAAYLKRFAKGASRAEATEEGALAALSAGDAKQAGATLLRLAEAATREERGRLRELAGVAALRAGDRAGAVALFTDVAQTLPLTYPASAARARLRELSVEPPPLIPASSSSAPEPIAVSLPPLVATLVDAGLDRDAERALLNLEREVSGAHPGREGEALCTAYGALERASRRYRIGVREVSWSVLMNAPGPGETWTWDCLYPTPYLDKVRELEAQHKLPAGLLHAIMRQESAFAPEVTSPVGAEGLLQLMPYTAEKVAAEMGTSVALGDLTRPAKNLPLGAHYVAGLLSIFEGSVPLAVASYNAGPQAVGRWVAPAAEMDADLFIARIPFSETRRYVARVLTNQARYGFLFGGEAAVPELALHLPATPPPKSAY